MQSIGRAIELTTDQATSLLVLQFRSSVRVVFSYFYAKQWHIAGIYTELDLHCSSKQLMKVLYTAVNQSMN